MSAMPGLIQDDVRLLSAVRSLPANRLRFQSWVHAYGCARLAAKIGVQQRTVERWAYGVSQTSTPKPAAMICMRVLSELEPHAFGPLTYDDMLTATIASLT